MNKILMWVLIVMGALIVISGGLVVAEMFLGTQQIKKPAIYLYPQSDMDISVHLKINGKLTITDPIYVDGWNVHAQKEGVITYYNENYDYLFYEAKLNRLSLPDEGWIVKYENLDQWFNIYLKKLGLNEKEIEQFKEYWMMELPKKNYYEIHLLDKEFLDDNMQLLITPEPDLFIRVNLHFKGLNYKKEIVEPKISVPERRGFTVVEWGGILS